MTYLHTNFSACECKTEGEKNGNNGACSDRGVCNCKDNVTGDKCDKCEVGYQTWPACDECTSDHFRDSENKCVGKFYLS